ncbi:hypothetical protein IFM89_007774 [Coptis chinensis]|uniref:Fe2OG dioxygenase domain-containing protein n=1 Tax=Coptis chinensis TaxID=261450 RepID=A0A835ITZ9_9MAGN|nr:hypothetical protein IFM89_007774 [Coptis chinensis]
MYLRPITEKMTDTTSHPPLVDQYGSLSHNASQIQCDGNRSQVIEECELPLIDLSYLRSQDEKKRQACAAAIASASSEWGFFQVVNHGISPNLLGEMRKEQMKLFELPFKNKASCGLLNDSYRWGNPRATSAKQFSWSEAFHIPLTMISEEACYGELSSLRYGSDGEIRNSNVQTCSNSCRRFSRESGTSRRVFGEVCNESTCFLRLNRYPQCSIQPEMFGLVPHTDSDFLTILYQDQVGGLQLMKDSKWVAVKPNPQALIVNIGDLFQAWSNDIYKSVEHKVMANEKVERYSIAYFLCPSYDSLVGSCMEPSVYKKFTFGEFRKQVQEDVKKTGHKVGLPRFLL